MLDGIDPEGMDTLNTVAGYGLGTAIVAAVIAATLGVYLWVGGKLGKFSGDKSAKGLNAMWLACLGVTFITSASSAIAWGVSTGGTDNLMPEAAQPQDITVNREAPVSTCDQGSGERVFEEEDDPPSHDQRVAIFEDVAAGAEPLGQSDITVADALESLRDTDATITNITWTPVGPGCDGTNFTTAAGTEISVTTQEDASAADQVMGPVGPRSGGYSFEVPAEDDD
ncbi:MAG: hypothetical protein HLX51_01810 [Micrococcaceae bacterium]|nr:hypothetical protein [Micrococcaceae bacterium]